MNSAGDFLSVRLLCRFWLPAGDVQEVKRHCRAHADQQQRDPEQLHPKAGEQEHSPQKSQASGQGFAGEAGAGLVIFDMLAEKRYFEQQPADAGTARKAARRANDKGRGGPHRQQQSDGAQRQQDKARKEQCN